MSDLLCVTNRALCRGAFLERIEALAACGPRGILLREKDLPEEDYRALAEQVLKICGSYGTGCILHGFPAAALALHADGFHAPLPVLRSMSGAEREGFRTLGASCHSVEEAREAEALGCTYLTAGHIFATDCKMGAPPRGLDFLRSVCAAVALPVYAIGGISAGNFCAVRRCGAAGACVMSGAMTCEDPAAYLRSFEKGREHMTFDAHQLLLYAVTDRAWVGRQTLAEQIEDALLGGATMLQLREKELDRPSFLAEAREIKALCRRYGVPLIIDDDVEVALESGADGVHVGQADLPVAEIRRRAGRGFIIGATAKTVAQARAAEAAGADYLGVGAVFPSPTKQEALRITPEQLREICAAVSIPAVAIGGISLENLPALRGGGMRGIAVISALFGAGDIRQAAGQLKQEALSVIGR